MIVFPSKNIIYYHYADSMCSYPGVSSMCCQVSTIYRYKYVFVSYACYNNNLYISYWWLHKAWNIVFTNKMFITLLLFFTDLFVCLCVTYSHGRQTVGSNWLNFFRKPMHGTPGETKAIKNAIFFFKSRNIMCLKIFFLS